MNAPNDLSSKRIAVIGSNRGIGLEIARALSARGDRVEAICRKGSATLAELRNVTIHEGVDVTDDAALHRVASSLGIHSLDGLIVVAGVLERHGLDNFNAASIARQLETNALGPIRSVVALKGALKAGAKVGLLTSRMGSIADNTSGGAYGYRMSKAALNMGGKSLAIDLKAAGIAVVLLHPGFVRTEMTGGSGNVDADEAARGILARMDELTLARSGAFMHANGEELPW